MGNTVPNEKFKSWIHDYGVGLLITQEGHCTAITSLQIVFKLWLLLTMGAKVQLTLPCHIG